MIKRILKMLFFCSLILLCAQQAYAEEINPLTTESTRYEVNLPHYNGFKSYMSYTTLTNKESKQYKLQKYYATTEDGFRKVDGRYCIAIGSSCNAEIGQYVDLVLENSIVIPCIMADLKADIHTDDSNTFTVVTENPCCSEFIIDSDSLNPTVKNAGDISKFCEDWDSKVKYIVVYDVIILGES